MIVVLMAIVYMVAGWVGNKMEAYLLHKYIITDSYISEVKTRYYPKEWVMSVLHEFNDMAEGQEAVLFEKHKIDRKITIEDADDLSLLPFYLRDPEAPTYIGRTFENELNCRIILKTGMDYATFRTTLLHEYLHCLDFDHTEGDKNDLMYATDTESTEVSEENIKGYAKKVARKIWKNLKN